MRKTLFRLVQQARATLCAADTFEADFDDADEMAFAAQGLRAHGCVVRPGKGRLRLVVRVPRSPFATASRK